MRLVDGVLLVLAKGTTEKSQLQRGLRSDRVQEADWCIVERSKNPAHSSYYYYRKPADV